MEELRPGLWTWTAPHPDWTPDQGGPEGWERDVRCAALSTNGALLLLDPLAPPEGVLGLAEGRRASIVLTCAWHQRSAAALRAELDAEVYAPATGLPHLDFPARGYQLGDELAGGVLAAAAYYPDEVVLWLPHPRVIFAGDAFAAPPLRFQRSWLPPGVDVEQALHGLRPLLELPVEVVLVGHGEPVVEGARDALRAALEA